MADNDWIIVAPRTDQAIVDYLVQRASANGMRIRRVLWADEGPLRLYNSSDDLWRNLIADANAAEPCVATPAATAATAATAA